MDVDGDELRVKAAAAVADAIKLDTGGSCEAAAASYAEAAAALTQLLDSGRASDANCDALQRKIAQYTRRAEQLRTSQFVHALPDVPDGVGSLLESSLAEPARAAEPAKQCSEEAGAPTGDPPRPESAPSHAASAGTVAALRRGFDNSAAALARAKELDEQYQVTTTIGCAAVATYEIAKSLEEDYKVSTKVKEGAIGAYETAQKIEEDYKITQNVVEGMKTAAEKARQAEEEYKLSERASTAASTLYQQALEYEAKNQISAKVYAAMQEGWEAVKDAAAQVAQPIFCPRALRSFGQHANGFAAVAVDACCAQPAGFRSALSHASLLTFRSQVTQSL